MENARRLNRPSNKSWEIIVQPDANADVSVVLPADRPCDTTGAICTPDGEKLSKRLEVNVTGPDGQPLQTTASVGPSS